MILRTKGVMTNPSLEATVISVVVLRFKGIMAMSLGKVSGVNRDMDNFSGNKA